ncbi:MAG: peptidylprolyl isomerase [Ferruginibacter sp.]
MKKFYLLFATALCSFSVFSQTLFTYGNNVVTKDEFLRAYNKNSTPVTDKEKSLREYLELYSNFKLKVKAAELLRLDTLPQIQNDIDNFRRQVEENYMNDEKGLNSLMNEAFYRSQKDIHVIHFAAPVLPGAKPEDTLKAYQSIVAAQQVLASGDKNYTLLSEKNNVKYGDLGFLTVFSVPYEYENIIYSLKPGEVSKPYRTKNGWHLFKSMEERKSIGKWKVAQILFIFPPDAGEEVRISIQHRADSVYNLLKGGAEFSKLAKEFSDDRLTYMTGGEMPEFGTGRFDQAFESQVLKLKSDGEISKPFQTDFGIHIVKRISFTETPSQKENAALQYEHKQKILQDSRINNAKDKFSKEIISLIGYKKNDAIKNTDLFRYADSVMKDISSDNMKEYPISNKTIITYKNGSVKGAEWLKFIREYKANTELYKGESNPELWNKFSTMTALNYYKKNLETYNADFKFQMKEFKEGNMLFEIMERNVWSMAATDSTGLLAYYNANRSKYKWAASADIIMVTATDEKVARQAMDSLKHGKGWKQIAEESNAALQTDSGRYELSQIIDPGTISTSVENTYSPIIKNTDGSAAFVKYIKIYPADQPRNFEEARGLVINDYQVVLEKKWLDLLHKKYPVKINEAIVKQMVN